MDLPHVCNLSMLYSIPFPALPKLLLSATNLVRLSLGIFLIPGTFHPRRSSLAWPRWPTSNLSPLNSNPFYLAPTGKTDVHRHQHAPSSLLSLVLSSKGTANTWRISWPGSMPLYLTPSYITFFHQLIFDIPQLARFMRRTTRLQALNEAHVDFD